MSILGLSLGIMTLIGVIFANTIIGSIQSGFLFCGLALLGLLLATADNKAKGLKIAAQVVCIVSIGLNGFVGYVSYSNTKVIEEEKKQRQLAYENAVNEEMRMLEESKQNEERTNPTVNLDSTTVVELNKYSEMSEVLNHDLSSINLYFDYDINTGTYMGKAYKYVKRVQPERNVLYCFDTINSVPRVYPYQGYNYNYVDVKRILFGQNPIYRTKLSDGGVVAIMVTIYDGLNNQEYLLDIDENGLSVLVDTFEDCENKAIENIKTKENPNRKVGIQEEAITGFTDEEIINEAIERTSEFIESDDFNKAFK